MPNRQRREAGRHPHRFVGSTRSTLQTDGNFTAVAGDIYRMSDLFKASAPTGQTIAGFRVALGGVRRSGGGQLLLNGAMSSPPHQLHAPTSSRN